MNKYGRELHNKKTGYCESGESFPFSPKLFLCVTQ